MGRSGSDPWRWRREFTPAKAEEFRWGERKRGRNMVWRLPPPWGGRRMRVADSSEIRGAEEERRTTEGLSRKENRIKTVAGKRDVGRAIEEKRDPKREK